MALREDQIQRYARHILLREVGGVGQTRLLAATVRVDGHEQAAETAAAYLIAAGVGTVRLDAAVRARAGRHLNALNPDVALGDATEGAATDTVVAPRLPGRRLDGALAALSAIMTLSGVPHPGWRIDGVAAHPYGGTV